MKKLSLTCALLLTALMSARALHAEPAARNKLDNLITNGGFETDSNHDDAPDYWFVHPGNRDAVEGSETLWVHKDPAEGASFLRVKKTGGTQPFQVSNLLPDSLFGAAITTQDAPMLLRAKVRGLDLSSAPSVVLQIFARKPGEAGMRFVNHIVAKPAQVPGNNWVVVEARFRFGDIIAPGEEVARVEVILRNPSNTGYADFDDVALLVAK
jgi:hypothetical protein